MVLQPPFLTKLRFEQLDLGTTPLVATGIEFELNHIKWTFRVKGEGAFLSAWPFNFPPFFLSHLGVKSFTAAADEITIDIEFKFAGNPQVVLGVAVAGVPIPIEVKHLECYGTIRLQLKPLIPVWPCFGAISIAFTRKPTITFSLQVLKRGGVLAKLSIGVDLKIEINSLCLPCLCSFTHLCSHLLVLRFLKEMLWMFLASITGLTHSWKKH